MTSLLPLAARVEALDGPDREVDGLVWKAIFERPDDTWLEFDDCWHRRDAEDGLAYEAPPALTASLDAVATLITEKLPGWALNVGSCHAAFLSDGEPPFSADIMGNVREVQPGWGEPPEMAYDSHSGKARTPALALLAAALRALASQENRK